MRIAARVKALAFRPTHSRSQRLDAEGLGDIDLEASSHPVWKVWVKTLDDDDDDRQSSGSGEEGQPSPLLGAIQGEMAPKLTTQKQLADGASTRGPVLVTFGKIASA